MKVYVDVHDKRWKKYKIDFDKIDILEFAALKSIESNTIFNDGILALSLSRDASLTIVKVRLGLFSTT